MKDREEITEDDPVDVLAGDPEDDPVDATTVATDVTATSEIPRLRRS